MNQDPLQPHSHEPNPDPPDLNPTFRLILPGGNDRQITAADLTRLPQTTVTECFIVSTGHGTSGPFTFSGVALADLIAAYYTGPWQDAEIISADGFGNRVSAREVGSTSSAATILLATHIDARPMTRDEGLVRLIVPDERDDALRQVKWISAIRIQYRQLSIEP